jgi:hypothetical protein
MCGFIEWLHHWQELIGAVLGAAALIYTVWITLGSERRKREDEANSLRVALGAEVRQFAVNALKVYREVLSLLPENTSTPWAAHVALARLQKIVRFPDPVIFPHSAPNLGSLGENAHEIVQFFNQISTIFDKVEHSISADGLPAMVTTPALAQMIEAAEALLAATETAVKTLPAFADTPQSEHDAAFATSIAIERQKFGPLLAKYRPAQ